MSTPVRVDFDLRTPMVVYAGVKTLDALLSWAAVERAKFNGSLQEWSDQHQHGLQIHRVGQSWCPMASELDVEWASEAEPLHYVKRQKLEPYALAWGDGVLKKRPAFDSARGTTKAGSMFVSIRWVKAIRAWAMVDDLAVFEGLVPWITHIGKLHHKDFGAVRAATVTVDEQARSKWMRRPLPVGSEHLSDSHVMVMGKLQSPYWQRTGFEPVFVPVD